MAENDQVKLYQNITGQEWIDSVKAFADQRVVMAYGATGIGKTERWRAYANSIKETHIPIYVLVPRLALGDLLFPAQVMDENGRVRAIDFVPNELFQLNAGKPLNILWDEIGKATDRGVIKQLRGCLLDKEIGRFKFPEGTIQAAATNLPEEGFGDMLEAYESSTMAHAVLRNPTATEWIEGWAMDAKIHPTVIQTVDDTRDMLASFKDYKKDCDPTINPYINFPNHPRPAFTSPRTLHILSDWLYASEGMPNDVRTHIAGGIVGFPAAQQVMSMHLLYDQLTPISEILKAPDQAKVPDHPGAQCLFIYSAIQRMDEKSVNPLMTYVARFPRECQALFATTVSNTTKADIACNNQLFYDWASENGWLFNNN